MTALNERRHSPRGPWKHRNAALAPRAQAQRGGTRTRALLARTRGAIATVQRELRPLDHVPPGRALVLGALAGAEIGAALLAATTSAWGSLGFVALVVIGVALAFSGEPVRVAAPESPPSYRD